MKPTRLIPIAALLAAALSLGPVQAQTAKDLEDAMGAEGLKAVKSKDLDMLYTRPGATLAAYKKGDARPRGGFVQQELGPERAPAATSSSGAAERENIRTGVAKITQDQFAKLSQANNGYPIVNEAGPDVLRAKVRVMNLYVNAPDAAGGGTNTHLYDVGGRGDPLPRALRFRDRPDPRARHRPARVAQTTTW
jgi:hypothetical protein